MLWPWLLRLRVNRQLGSGLGGRVDVGEEQRQYVLLGNGPQMLGVFVTYAVVMSVSMGFLLDETGNAHCARNQHSPSLFEPNTC